MLVRVILRIALVFMLVFSLGLHWAMLQTIAWTGMLITYAHNEPIQEAIVKTFGGEHPCALCHAIQSGRAEEKKQQQQQIKPSFKLDLVPIWQPTEFDFSCDFLRLSGANLLAHSRAESPPKPRPRGILDNHARA